LGRKKGGFLRKPGFWRIIILLTSFFFKILKKFPGSISKELGGNIGSLLGRFKKIFLPIFQRFRWGKLG